MLFFTSIFLQQYNPPLVSALIQSFHCCACKPQGHIWFSWNRFSGAGGCRREATRIECCVFKHVSAFGPTPVRRGQDLPNTACLMGPFIAWRIMAISKNHALHSTLHIKQSTLHTLRSNIATPQRFYAPAKMRQDSTSLHSTHSTLRAPHSTLDTLLHSKHSTLQTLHSNAP